MTLELDQLSVATFKGVRFPCNDTTTTVGRAKIVHRFANSNKNNVEDQGGNPRVYQLTAIILGENYIRDRDQLLSAIESPGTGVLIHPFYGRIENAEAMPVTFDETVKRLGRVEIPITFEISDSEGIPAITQRSTSGITSLKDSLIDTTSTDFANTFNVTNSFTGNFNAAQDKLTSFVGAINDNVTITSVTEQSAASFRSKLDTFTRNINTLISSPTQLAQGVTGLMNDISGLYDTPEQTLDVSRRFFTFGNDDTPIIATTAGLIERLQNQQIFNETVQASSLGVAYEAAALTQFRTVNEVDETSRALETVYRILKG